MKASDFVILSKKLKRIDLERILRDILKRSEHDIIDLQQEQLSAGIADKGDDIYPAYTKNTIERKKKKGQPFDRVTLKDRGAFYRRMHAKFAKDHFELTSSNGKKSNLVDKYHGVRGGDIFGLTQENREFLVFRILPEIKQKYREQLEK